MELNLAQPGPPRERVREEAEGVEEEGKRGRKGTREEEAKMADAAPGRVGAVFSSTGLTATSARCWGSGSMTEDQCGEF